MGEAVAGESSGSPSWGLTPGAVVAGYRVEARIGAGGMAVVFRARDVGLGRTAALKILAPALAGDREFRERFIRESWAAAAVDHPHIIPVYAAGEADGILYIAKTPEEPYRTCAEFAAAFRTALGVGTLGFGAYSPTERAAGLPSFTSEAPAADAPVPGSVPPAVLSVPAAELSASPVSPDLPAGAGNTFTSSADASRACRRGRAVRGGLARKQTGGDPPAGAPPWEQPAPSSAVPQPRPH